MGKAKKIPESSDAVFIRVEPNASVDDVTRCLRQVEAKGRWGSLKRLIIINFGPANRDDVAEDKLALN
jgi:hypothetical protein